MPNRLYFFLADPDVFRGLPRMYVIGVEVKALLPRKEYHPSVVPVCLA